MTPKEKAEELFFKYWPICEPLDEQAKQCAIIAVDEVIESGVKWMPQVEWWMAVKKEIKNL